MNTNERNNNSPGTGLDERQIRALYRNKEFREMYQEMRRRYGQDYYFKRLTREELFRRTL
jgi:hypothetical protein